MRSSLVVRFGGGNTSAWPSKGPAAAPDDGPTMQRIIVDATMLVAAMFKDGATRRLILHPPDGVRFCAPELLAEEAAEQVDRVAAKAEVPVETIRQLVVDLLDRIQPIPDELLDSVRATAHDLCARATASDDEDYVAAALALDVPIWTFDPDFARVAKLRQGLRVWTRAEILRFSSQR